MLMPAVGTESHNLKALVRSRTPENTRSGMPVYVLTLSLLGF